MLNRDNIPTDIQYIRTIRFGDRRDHPHIGTALHNLSVAYVLLCEEYDKALPICIEALRIRKKSLEEFHVDIIVRTFMIFIHIMYVNI